MHFYSYNFKEIGISNNWNFIKLELVKILHSLKSLELNLKKRLAFRSFNNYFQNY